MYFNENERKGPKAASASRDPKSRLGREGRTGTIGWSSPFAVSHPPQETPRHTGKRGTVWFTFVSRLFLFHCDERLKSKSEGSARLTYSGLLGGLEHLKIETRLIDETFASVMGECVM